MQSLYSALNILLLDLKSVKCVCIETAQTWTYFTYFTYFIYIDIHNRTLGIVWIDIQIIFSFICWRKGTCNNWQWIIQNIISEYIEKRIICHSTAGHEGAVADISYTSIFSACFGLPTSVQLAATTCTCQIWISGWILPHFDVRTISVAWKLKKLSNIFWQKIFFLLHPLSKGVAPLCIT